MSSETQQVLYVSHFDLNFKRLTWRETPLYSGRNKQTESVNTFSGKTTDPVYRHAHGHTEPTLGRQDCMYGDLSISKNRFTSCHKDTQMLHKHSNKRKHGDCTADFPSE